MAVEQVADAPPPYDAIVFDCDSTLSAIEGIDELASSALRPSVEALTSRAMAGELSLEQVYKCRLELLKPDRRRIEDLGRAYVAAALPHAQELVAALHALGKSVWILSGGLRPAVLELARALGVAPERVLAVDIYFDSQGRYAGFDETSPLTRSGGKLDELCRIARGSGSRGLALAGDGMTDLEAAGCARRFVAFGGVARRAPVFERARVTCASRDLAALLPLLCSAEELEHLGRSGVHRELLASARSAAG
jgi:phosphoserine phosphatase